MSKFNKYAVRLDDANREIFKDNCGIGTELFQADYIADGNFRKEQKC